MTHGKLVHGSPFMHASGRGSGGAAADTHLHWSTTQATNFRTFTPNAGSDAASAQFSCFNIVIPIASKFGGGYSHRIE